MENKKQWESAGGASNGANTEYLKITHKKYRNS